MAESEKTIENLPDEVVVEIFSYLSFDDLVFNVQNVCMHWKTLAHDARLWRDFTFKPTEVMSQEKVIQVLQRTPRLKSFAFTDVDNSANVIDILCKQCKDITSIICNLPEMTDDILLKLAKHLPEIESLHVHPSLLKGTELFIILSKFPHLKTLKSTWAANISSYNAGAYFNRREVTYHCETLQNLEIVSLYDINEIIQKLIQCNASNLLSLSLYGISTIVLPEVPKCHNLQKLNLNFLSRVCDNFRSVLPEIGKLRNLKSLSIRLFLASQKDVLCTLFVDGRLPSLTELDLRNCMNFSRQVAESIARCCMGLQRLNLKACCNLDDKCLESLARCRDLRIVDLSGCTGVTEVGLCYLATCHQLHTLSLCWLGGVTGPMLASLAGAVRLQKLFLDHNELHQPDVVSLASNLPELTSISVVGCPDMDFVKLQKNLPKCRIYSIKPTLRNPQSGSPYCEQGGSIKQNLQWNRHKPRTFLLCYFNANSGLLND